MSDSSRKLSPAEFLAELKQRRPENAPATPARSTRGWPVAPSSTGSGGAGGAPASTQTVSAQPTVAKKAPALPPPAQTSSTRLNRATSIPPADLAELRAESTVQSREAHAATIGSTAARDQTGTPARRAPTTEQRAARAAADALAKFVGDAGQGDGLDELELDFSDLDAPAETTSLKDDARSDGSSSDDCADDADDLTIETSANQVAIEPEAASVNAVEGVFDDAGVADAATELEAEGGSADAGSATPVNVSAVKPAARGSSPKPPDPTIFLKRHSHLSELFERVHKLLGERKPDDGPFRPRAPESLEETRLTADEVEQLALKFLMAKGTSTGRGVCAQIKLPFPIVEPILKQLKADHLLTYRGTAEMGDYEYAITEQGRERARRYTEECSYYGAAPVSLQDYLKAMAAQSIADQEVTPDNLHSAFKDLIISREMLDQLGPAINSGRGMFLFGEPGNGKTSIAERITRCFGSSIWIPRALGIDGDIIRLYDPGVHEEVEDAAAPTLFQTDVDQRWVHIVRPTVIAGGELTMRELEVTQNSQTKICEAPLQLKSNCGTFVIDDFGRQTMPVTVLLNRWIVPLEKRYDFLNLPSGKKVQVPFDQLIIFSTNLEPKDLVDGAFLRRIPYKIQVPDPTEEEFHRIFQVVAPKMGFTYDKATVDYLIATHFRGKRPMRSCQPRDLMLQVKNFSIYRGLPRKMSPEAFDFAVKNYFSVM